MPIIAVVIPPVTAVPHAPLNTRNVIHFGLVPIYESSSPATTLEASGSRKVKLLIIYFLNKQTK